MQINLLDEGGWAGRSWPPEKPGYRELQPGDCILSRLDRFADYRDGEADG